MIKKRLIFTLLYDDGNFMLSRNFRLQKAGSIEWLRSNYDFKKIAFTIDELIVLDVSRKERDIIRFCDHIMQIGRGCFIPIAAGGGIASHDHAKSIINSGAEKLVLNTALYKTPSFVRELVSVYGSQCIIGSVDVKRSGDEIEVYIDNGTTKVELTFESYVEHIVNLGIGELYLNSMDNDGTGHGYLLDIMEHFKIVIKIPIIIAGGAGNWHHLLEGLQHDKVDAAATANLFNFIGQGFPNARKQLLNEGIRLAKWNTSDFDSLKNILHSSHNRLYNKQERR